MGVAGEPSPLLRHLRRRLNEAEVPEPHVLYRPRRRADITGFLGFHKDKTDVFFPVVHPVVYQVCIRNKRLHNSSYAICKFNLQIAKWPSKNSLQDDKMFHSMTSEVAGGQTKEPKGHGSARGIRQSAASWPSVSENDEST